MQEIAQLLQYRRHAATGKEVFHVIGADGLQVDQHRRLVRQPVETVEIDLDPGTPRDGGEMDNGVGRAGDRQQHPPGVLDRLLGDDLARQ